MSKDPNENTIGELIQSFIVQRKGSDFYDGMKIVDSWKKVVGPFIEAHTKDIYFRRGVLFVRLDSDSLRSELSFSKSSLITHLNRLAETTTLKEIVFH